MRRTACARRSAAVIATRYGVGHCCNAIYTTGLAGLSRAGGACSYAKCFWDTQRHPCHLTRPYAAP